MTNLLQAKVPSPLPVPSPLSDITTNLWLPAKTAKHGHRAPSESTIIGMQKVPKGRTGEEVSPSPVDVGSGGGCAPAQKKFTVENVEPPGYNTNHPSEITAFKCRHQFAQSLAQFNIVIFFICTLPVLHFYQLPNTRKTKTGHLFIYYKQLKSDVFESFLLPGSIKML